MALVHVIRNGPEIDAKHVGTTGSQRDDSATLWLDGTINRTRPDPLHWKPTFLFRSGRYP